MLDLARFSDYYPISGKFAESLDLGTWEGTMVSKRFGGLSADRRSPIKITMSYKACSKVILFVSVLLYLSAIGSMAQDNSIPIRDVEDFSGVKAGAFPEGWKCVWSSAEKGKEVYSVKSEQQSYLEARAVNNDILIAKEFKYDLKEYPFLTWQWKAIELPEGADERLKETGDSGAGIYVVFPGWFRPDNIKYVWSSSLPKGISLESPYNHKTKIVVLRNRSTSLGKWVSEEVNVYEDYKRLFGHEPDNVRAIAIMSDSNDTGSKAEAHYRQICISKRSAQPKPENKRQNMTECPENVSFKKNVISESQ